MQVNDRSPRGALLDSHISSGKMGRNGREGLSFTYCVALGLISPSVLQANPSFLPGLEQKAPPPTPAPQRDLLMAILGSQPTPPIFPSHPSLGWERKGQAALGLEWGQRYPRQPCRDGRGSWLLSTRSGQGGGGSSVAQRVWLEPQGPTLLPRDSHIRPDTQCRPLQMAVRKEKKQHTGF